MIGNNVFLGWGCTVLAGSTIGDNVIISDTETGHSYTEAEFNNLYATFNITISSEYKEVAYSILSQNANTTAIVITAAIL